MAGCDSLCHVYNCSGYSNLSPVQTSSFSMLNISFLKELLPLLGLFIYFLAMLKLFYKARDAEEETNRIKVEMEIRISDLTARHNEQLELERKKSSSFCIKMRMQHRDCMARVGGVKRKLKEQNGLLDKLNGKLASLEWAEEDANDLVEELEEARNLIDEKDQEIEEAKKDLEMWKKNQGLRELILETQVRDLQKRLRMAQENEENKENMCS